MEDATDAFGESILEMALDEIEERTQNRDETKLQNGKNPNAGIGGEGLVMMAQMMMGPVKVCGSCGKDVAENLYVEHTTTWCVAIQRSW
eukprot:TRINITY_DN43986_c0_g1_i1.p1 TRINITY_DN43986_c0_g1~~TRINITY_DN43986_c0_g1_i1.p1  ORF type:complete len:100 (+),score=23.21 TRINITY_DN43986_c0_g1_i1:36-302(+)